MAQFSGGRSGWQYLSRNSEKDPTKVDRKKPVVYFGSFQDLLGHDEVIPARSLIFKSILGNMLIVI